MPDQTLDVETLHQMIAGGECPLLLDVRTRAEYASARIEGAVSMPLSRLDPGEVGRMLDGHRSCVLVCLHGARALQALGVLRDSGLTGLSVLEGGMARWQAAGYAVEGTGKSGLRIGPRLIFGFLFLAALALGHEVEPAFYGFAVFAAAGFLNGGLPCCGGQSGRGGGCGGGCSCNR